MTKIIVIHHHFQFYRTETFYPRHSLIQQQKKKSMDCFPTRHRRTMFYRTLKEE